MAIIGILQYDGYPQPTGVTLTALLGDMAAGRYPAPLSLDEVSELSGQVVRQAQEDCLLPVGAVIDAIANGNGFYSEKKNSFIAGARQALEAQGVTI